MHDHNTVEAAIDADSGLACIYCRLNLTLDILKFVKLCNLS